MVLKLYCDLLSQPCRSILIFMKLNKIPFENVRIDLGAGKQFSKEFSAVNPFCKVPVLADGDLVLKESMSIFRYLAATQPIPDHWYPVSDPVRSAVVEEYLHWQHFNTRANGAGIFLSSFIIPTQTKRPPNFKSVHKYVKQFYETCSDLEEVFLKNGNYIGNRDEISVADLAACAELWQPLGAGFEIEDRFPVLSAYMERIRSETQPEFDEAHKIIWTVKKKFADSIQEGYRSYVSTLPPEEKEVKISTSQDKKERAFVFQK